MTRRRFVAAGAHTILPTCIASAYSPNKGIIMVESSPSSNAVACPWCGGQFAPKKITRHQMQRCPMRPGLPPKRIPSATVRCSECGEVVLKADLTAHQKSAHSRPGINRGQAVVTPHATGRFVCKGCGAAMVMAGEDYCRTCMGNEGAPRK